MVIIHCTYRLNETLLLNFLTTHFLAQINIALKSINLIFFFFMMAAEGLDSIPPPLKSGGLDSILVSVI